MGFRNCKVFGKKINFNRQVLEMSIKLSANDFLEGGQFFHLTVEKKLPIPKDILQYLYGNCFEMDKLLQVNLLKYVWKLKGVEMFKCLCHSNAHLITKEEYNEQQNKQNHLKKEDFFENGKLFDVDLKTDLPMDLSILKHVWGELSYFENIENGECFKSNEYLLQLMKEAYNLKYKDIDACICICRNHLIIMKN